jgi:uncharacterized protein YecE (DUF72 family)
MRIRTGTSGFSYKQWRGSFYPRELPADRYLAYYATRLDTVEINNTFYRMPTRALLEGWRDAVPEAFTFVLKAPQRITHQKRLQGAEEALGAFLQTAAALDPGLGPLLFQLPPYLKKDVPRLRQFLALLPPSTRAALEFRHASWFDDEVYAVLAEAGAALCAADTDESGDAGPPLVATGGFGYLRLRRSDYDEAALRGWLARIRGQPWSESYVFFKHEDEGKGPALAERLKALVGAG